MSEGKYLESVILVPKIKYLRFGQKTKDYIRKQLIMHGNKIFQGSTLKVLVNGYVFDFRVYEATPNGGFLLPSTRFEIPNYGPVSSEIPAGHWWRY